jgi:anthranilate synthase component 1
MIGQGGIVFDSDPYDEWMETINKLGGRSPIIRPSGRTTTDRCLRTGANTHCITSAEEKHLAEQEDGESESGGNSHATSLDGDAKTRISLVAG